LSDCYQDRPIPKVADDYEIFGMVGLGTRNNRLDFWGILIYVQEYYYILAYFFAYFNM